MKIMLVMITLMMAWEADACSCMRPDPNHDVAVREAWTRATAVVLATAETVEKVPGSSIKPGGKPQHEITTFTRLKHWKGDVPESFETSIVTECCLCGISFSEGQTYLLYLYKSEGSDHYSTSICNRNMLHADADADMARLDRIVGNK